MRRTIISAALALGALAGTARAQDPNRFEWKGDVPAGAWVVVRNMNGAITVDGAAGRGASIVGTKHADNGGDPSVVRFVSRPLANGGILVCALWGDESSCDENSYHSHDDEDDDRRSRRNVSVDFTVSLPQGTNVRVASVNGEVAVDGATAEVAASTVNGTVRAKSSGGPVEAKTVNGDVRASMKSLGAGDLDFRTVNGSIELELPAALQADIDLRTVNGSFRTDFPVTMNGLISPRRLSGKIGNGGRELRATTVNGSIELRKST